MTFVYIEPSESLLTKLSELYIKYINVKQINSDDKNQIGLIDIDNEKTTNKFVLMFEEIQKNIGSAAFENMKANLCSSIKKRYLDDLTKPLKISESTLATLKSSTNQDNQNLQNAIKYLKTKIELIEHLIAFVATFNYSTLTSLDTCRSSFNMALLIHLDKIQTIVKERAIPLLYEHIKGDINQVIVSQNIAKVEEANSVLMGEQTAVAINLSKELEIHISSMLEIPEEITDDKKYLLLELENKYKDFLSITNQNFTQEIKNKIKKSVIELVFAEIKIKKRLNLKKPLLVTNVLTEFFAL